jgi:hypothetical protein
MSETLELWDFYRSIDGGPWRHEMVGEHTEKRAIEGARALAEAAVGAHRWRVNRRRDGVTHWSSDMVGTMRASSDEKPEPKTIRVDTGTQWLMTLTMRDGSVRRECCTDDKWHLMAGNGRDAMRSGNAVSMTITEVDTFAEVVE